MSALGGSGLPPELIIHIVTYSSPSVIVVLEQICKGWSDLISGADAPCWRRHALSYTTSGVELSRSSRKGRIGLSEYIDLTKDRCLDQSYWDGVKNWKDVCRRQKLLCENYSPSWNSKVSSTSSSSSLPPPPPKTHLDILGFKRVDPTQSSLPIPKLRSLTSSRLLHVPYASQESSYVWRARLDTARDANFIVTTWHTGGLRVVDASRNGSGSVLWELPRWSVRPYAHLEYKRGTACWDAEQGIEVWKRWKIVLGKEGEDEPANKRGQFVKVATLDDLPNTRGFMLNDDLHLTICSSDGKSITYDLSTNGKPKLLYSYDIDMTPSNGPAGHLEHDSATAIYSMGQKGYTIYHKDTATLLGTIDFSNQSSTLNHTLSESRKTNYFKIDSKGRYPELVVASGILPKKEFVTVALESGGLGERHANNETEVHESFLQILGGGNQSPVSEEEKRANGIPLHHDLWGAAMIRKLEDGATLLIARSRGGRVLICSDLLGLLASMRGSNEEEARIKIMQSVALIECGGRATRTEFYTGGWLTAGNGRAAWEVDDVVYLCPLPEKRNTLPRAGTPIWMIPSHYNDEIPMPDMQIPISFMSLDADDVFISTYLHPAYIFVTDRIHSRWETTILKSIRIIHFAPQLAPGEAALECSKDEDDNAMFPLTNANKNEHRRWIMTGRRLAQAAEAEEEEEWGQDPEWTDDEQAEVEDE